MFGAPTKTSSASVINGEKKFNSSLVYKLRPKASGKMLVKSPKFIVDGQSYSAEPILITVIPTNLSAGEISEINKQNFIKNKVKPVGTKRIVFRDDIGYIEEYTQKGWEVLRRLSEDELEIINAIDK